MSNDDNVRSLVVLDTSHLAFMESVAAEYAVAVEMIPRRGIDPLTTTAVVLLGTAAAVDAVLRALEHRKGGQVIDLRSTSSKAFYRTQDVLYGLVIIVTSDGTVSVEIKEPAGMFSKMVSSLPKLLSVGQKAAEVARTVEQSFGSDASIEVNGPQKDEK